MFDINTDSGIRSIGTIEGDKQSIADFIAETRQRLTLLNVRVNSDVTGLEDALKAANRRIAYLENALPDLHAQRRRITDLERDVRLMTDILAALVSDIARKKEPFWKRFYSDLIGLMTMELHLSWPISAPGREQEVETNNEPSVSCCTVTDFSPNVASSGL